MDEAMRTEVRRFSVKMMSVASSSAEMAVSVMKRKRPEIDEEFRLSWVKGHTERKDADLQSSGSRLFLS